jgi:tetratricopeptide (TPR) repeat protein
MPTEPTRRRPGRYLLPLVVCLITNAPRAASASNEAESDAEVALAEQKAGQAFEAYQDKRFAQAVALYIEAYEAAPNGDILYNIARIYDIKLGDRPLAINFYRRYIADPGAVSGRIQLANERLAALREAELAASRPLPSPQAVSAAGGVGAANPVASAPGWTGAEWTGAILAATGVVGIGIGAGFGIAAMNETRTAHDLCEGDLCSEQRGIDAAEAATDHALVSTIGFASGGALLALGAVFYLAGGEPSEKPAQAATHGLALDGRLLQNQGGWSLEVTGSW